MRRLFHHGLAVALVASALATAKSWPVDGLVISIDRATATVLVSHRPIEKLMGAMLMPFRAERPSELDSLQPGDRIHFDLVNKRSVARNIRKTGETGLVIQPSKDRIEIGQPVPDLALTSETGDAVRFADLRGKVLAIDFIYSRCPLPDVCPRLSANFAAIQKRLAAYIPNDLVLLTITVDPDYDTPPILAEYARRWGAKSPGWRFLTGNVAPAAAAFGEIYWTDEGSIGHNSNTLIVDRNGRLVAVVAGSGWRADQLEHLLKHELEK